MAELKNMTVVTSGKLRKTAYDLLDANTNLLAWKEGGRTPADIFDGWLAQADALYSIGNIKINGALLDKAPNLKVIAQLPWVTTILTLRNAMPAVYVLAILRACFLLPWQIWLTAYN